MDIVPTYRKLLANQPQPEKVLQQERSSSALIFYWGVQHVFQELNLHNIFFADNYQAEFKALFETKNVVDDITVYVHISSKDEPSDAPAGCENWFVMVNVPSNIGQDWDEIIQRTRTNIINRISSQLKVNLSELISCESILDPRSIEFKTQSYQGALYGAASNDRYAAFLRHPNFSRTIDNIYFCGGSVHPGGGIPLCLLSAKITSDLIGKP
jgi:phytoene dehydrogenase-like protein